MPTTIAELALDVIEVFSPVFRDSDVGAMVYFLFLVSAGGLLVKRTLRSLSSYDATRDPSSKHFDPRPYDGESTEDWWNREGWLYGGEYEDYFGHDD